MSNADDLRRFSLELQNYNGFEVKGFYLPSLYARRSRIQQMRPVHHGVLSGQVARHFWTIVRFAPFACNARFTIYSASCRS